VGKFSTKEIVGEKLEEVKSKLHKMEKVFDVGKEEKRKMYKYIFNCLSALNEITQVEEVNDRSEIWRNYLNALFSYNET